MWTRRSCFNPRARTGRDTFASTAGVAGVWFQSTRPHGARHADIVKCVIEALFQSTRPHGARPDQRGDLDNKYTFQSTRPHGARRNTLTGYATNGMFQSTRPHGARPCVILPVIIS